MSKVGFKKSLDFRILIFCWDDPVLEGYYLNLLEEIAKHIEIYPLVIVTSLLSKLRFIKNGIHAFTYNELITFNLESYNTVNDSNNLINKKVLLDLVDYDKKLGWKWIPKENISDKKFHLYQSSIILKAYDFLYKNFKPHLAITWNGVTLFQKALAFLAHSNKIPVLFVERGFIPQTLFIDDAGVNYKSSIAGDQWFKTTIPYPNKAKINKVKKYCEELREAKRSVVNIGKNIRPEELRKKLKINEKSKIVLFPLQIENDSNILYFSPYYSNMIQIIKDIQKAIALFNDIILIIKPHPEDTNRMNELVSITNNSTYILEDVNLYSLLELADLVITVNSNVGFEGLLYRKPVIVLGKAIYSEKGFTYELPSRHELSNLIDNVLKKHTFNEKEFYRFLIHILKYKIFHLTTEHDCWNSRSTIPKRISALMKTQNIISNNVDEKILNKLAENINCQKIFNKKALVILGSIDDKLEHMLSTKGKDIKKIRSFKDAIKLLATNVCSTLKPDLLLTTSPISFKRLVLMKIIQARMKVQIENNELKFEK